MSNQPKRTELIREAQRWGFVELTGRKHRIFVHPELPGTRLSFSHGAHSNTSAKRDQHKILVRAIATLKERQK